MYTGNILDPIHGVIKLSEIEKWFLTQKPFNRLRGIKQNTFLYLVFPSANHTRFEHSIGVLHLANLIYQSANDNYTTGILKKEKYKISDKLDFKFCSVKEKLGENEDVIIQELRLAALLHDIGHGPMSHKFDKYTITGEKLLEIIDGDKDLKIYKKSFERLISKTKKIDHEIVSCVFIIKLINKIKKIANKNNFNTNQVEIIKKINPARIVKMIEPKFDGIDKIELNGIDYTMFFSSIISSFPIDADRMDYLYRDSYFSGVKYGLYDLSRILMSFIPIQKDNKIFLSIKDSGIDAVIRFIQSRTHLYNQIYFHKTNRAANTMLDFACRKISNSTSIISASNYKSFENFYWKNSDEFFIKNTLQKHIKDKKEKQVLSELLNRKLWKRVYQKKIVITPNDDTDIENKKKKIIRKILKAAQNVENDGLDIAIDIYKSEVFKDIEKSSIKIVKKKDKGYEIVENWKSYNKELKILEYEVHMFRIYLRRQFKTPTQYRKMKDKVIKEFNEAIDMLEMLD